MFVVLYKIVFPVLLLIVLVNSEIEAAHNLKCEQCVKKLENRMKKLTNQIENGKPDVSRVTHVINKAEQLYNKLVSYKDENVTSVKNKLMEENEKIYNFGDDKNPICQKTNEKYNELKETFSEINNKLFNINELKEDLEEQIKISEENEIKLIQINIPSLITADNFCKIATSIKETFKNILKILIREIKEFKKELLNLLDLDSSENRKDIKDIFMIPEKDSKKIFQKIGQIDSALIDKLYEDFSKMVDIVNLLPNFEGRTISISDKHLINKAIKELENSVKELSKLICTDAATGTLED